MPVAKSIRYAYIKNDPNQYSKGKIQVTGWHMIQNNRMFHYLNPKEWHRIYNTAQSMRVNSVSVKVMNMIPIINTVAISQNATFTSFNNTIYALAYDDKYLETEWQVEEAQDESDWWQLWTREGVIPNGTGGFSTKVKLPQYSHQKMGTDGDLCYWDPLANHQDVMELRPGKNAVEFKWVNKRPGPTLVMRGAVMHGSRYNRNKDTTEPNQVDDILFANTQTYTTGHPQVISEGGGKAAEYYQKNFQMTSKAAANWRAHINYRPNGDTLGLAETFGVFKNSMSDPSPLPNWFIKMIPLFDDQLNVISAEAQVLLEYTMDYEIVPIRQVHGLNVPTFVDESVPGKWYDGSNFGCYGNNNVICMQTEWGADVGATPIHEFAQINSRKTVTEISQTTAGASSTTQTTTSTATRTTPHQGTPFKKPKVSFKQQ